MDYVSPDCKSPDSQQGNRAMPIVDDIKRDVAAAKQVRIPVWAYLPLIVAAFLVSWMFDHFGKLGEALPAINVIGMLGFVLVLKRKLMGRAWFWITMIAVAALHVLLVLFIPWTTKWVPALAIAVIDSLDVLAILALVAVIGRLVDGRKLAS